MVKKYEVLLVLKPPHVLEPEARKKSIDIKDMFIDIGIRSKADAEQYGIEIGNMITPYSEFEQLANGKYLTAKAFDNRYGCALAIDVLNNLKDESSVLIYMQVALYKKKLVYVALKSQQIKSTPI